MSIVRIAALENQNRNRAGDAPYRIRPACVIVDSNDTVRFLNRTGVSVQLNQFDSAKPLLTFIPETGEPTQAPMEVPNAERATVGHPGKKGRFRFRVMYENPPGGGFNTEIHAESSPEIIVDQ